MTVQQQAELIEKLQAEHRIVRVTYSEAALIRIVATKDIPEYNITEGSCFYLVCSDSLGENWYYIATWNYERMQWDCRCPATKPCRHMKLMSQDCKQPHTLQGYKPYTKGEKFALLLVKYDIRFQSPVIEAEEVAEVAFSKPIASVANRGTLNNANQGFNLYR